MKVAELNKFFFYLILSVTLSSGCGKDLGDDPVDPVDPIKPLTPAEILARYKPIKEYAEEYVPGITVGLGLGADIYLKDSDYKKLSDENGIDMDIIDQIVNMLTILSKNEQKELLRRNVDG